MKLELETTQSLLLRPLIHFKLKNLKVMQSRLLKTLWIKLQNEVDIFAIQQEESFDLILIIPFVFSLSKDWMSKK